MVDCSRSVVGFVVAPRVVDDISEVVRCAVVGAVVERCVSGKEVVVAPPGLWPSSKRVVVVAIVVAEVVDSDDIGCDDCLVVVV